LQGFYLLNNITEQQSEGLCNLYSSTQFFCMSRFSKIFILSLLLTACFPVWLLAQTGFVPVKDMNAIKEALIKNNQATQTVSSDFKQTKSMKMLNEKVVSKGLFYYKKSNRIRIEYTSPFQYLLIMNGANIIVKDEQKTSKVNTRNSKSLQSANRIMMDCMTGNVFNNQDFKVQCLAGTGQYLLQLTPVASSMKNLFSRIDIYLEQSDFSVSRLMLHETGGDTTVMDFTNRKKNISLSDALFSNP